MYSVSRSVFLFVPFKSHFECITQNLHLMEHCHRRSDNCIFYMIQWWAFLFVWVIYPWYAELKTIHSTPNENTVVSHKLITNVCSLYLDICFYFAINIWVFLYGTARWKYSHQYGNPDEASSQRVGLNLMNLVIPLSIPLCNCSEKTQNNP